MSNSHRSETNPYFRRQLGSPPPGQPHWPPSPVAQVSPPPGQLPARPQVQPLPQLRQPRVPQRVSSYHPHYPLQPPQRVSSYHPHYPLQPSEQTGFSQPPSSPVQPPLPQPGKTRRPKVQVIETPQQVLTAQSSPPSHDEQTQPLHTRTQLSPPPVQAPPPHPPQGHRHGQPSLQPSLLVIPTRKTSFVHWFLAVFCAIFWVVIIVGGLIVLIVYLVFRPHLPKFDISSATLNAAYLDMDYLLNADLTLLTNFTNPNRKVRNDFSYVILDLYYGSNAIATQYIEPFSTERLESRLANVHMISSQVRLPSKDSEKLKKQLESDGLVVFEVKGFVRVRSKLGSFLRYSYWLYSYCSIALTGPPSGVLRASKCRTKR
ncbi:NDR1/HIN1-like protein 13 [Syzygium oleosum]|uniref:NDR1/HIN1-like protein 13 n=1 Tax=Syzygium oleosum TaxID=219896 RepID=UPI0024BB25B0|nr:NDR1/HIN1-like protein 13 [Syzygium oleosum]